MQDDATWHRQGKRSDAGFPPHVSAQNHHRKATRAARSMSCRLPLCEAFLLRLPEKRRDRKRALVNENRVCDSKT